MSFKTISKTIPLLIIAILVSSAILADINDKYIELLAPTGQVSADGQLDVTVDESFLNGNFTEKLSIILPNGSIVYAVKESEEEMIQGYKAWYGHVEGEELSSAVFVHKKGEIRGNIHYSGGHFLVELQASGGYKIIDLYNSVKPIKEKTKPVEPNLKDFKISKHSSDYPTNTQIIDESGIRTVTVLDILRRSYFYDPPFEVQCSSQRLLQNAITNQALGNSGANVKVKLVACWVAAPYNSDYYDWLQTIYGEAMLSSELKELRDRYGADLISVVTRSGDDECIYTTGYPKSHISVVQELFDCASQYTYQKGIAKLLGAGYGGGAFPYSR